ncbi:MAG: ribonuclease Y [Prevotella sp.]|nr:ribonuclease Y [Staphylococcus sp.]MCM1350037.1 ribonuclease Y [Prevotella sp.]
MPDGIWILLIVVALLVGVLVGGYFMFNRGKQVIETKFERLGKDAAKIIEDAEKEGQAQKKELIREGKKEISEARAISEKEIANKKSELQEEARKLDRRETNLENRSDNLDKRESGLIAKETKLEQRVAEIEKRNNRIEELITEQEQKLMEIAGLNQEQAREIVFKRLEDELSMEMAIYVKDVTEKAKYEANHKSQVILANAIHQYANETVQEKTVSVVALPNDEMKGRIIGREGRNIRAIEAVTGVDLIIDDTPDSVVISCFDPIRREIARRTLEILVSDGRIQPPRIEEVYNKCTKELENEIREEGEKAVFETGIGKIHPELIKLIGRLRFRTSYGQNALSHSKEVAFLAGKLAVEIGEDEILARRAGLLHDIGKSTDHEQEGSHVDIGVEIATKFRENKVVINAIASHHGDVEANHVISELVAAADTLSAARPGARSESLDNYIKRLQQLEELSKEFKGVDKTYALQAGREVRILVKPEEITDAEAYKLARDIKQKIETTMNYPGTIKVTVIRETRVQEVAR